jgi:general secretion pathway protein H
VAALALTVIVIGLAFPFIPTGTTPVRLHGLLADTVALLRETRTASIARSTSIATTYDADRRTLRAGSRSVVIPPDVDFSLVAGGNCPIAGGLTGIVFRADGTNCGGVLRFAKASRILRARINWVDGHVDIAEGE